MSEFESDGPFQDHMIEKGQSAGNVSTQQRWSEFLESFCSIPHEYTLWLCHMSKAQALRLFIQAASQDCEVRS